MLENSEEDLNKSVNDSVEVSETVNETKEPVEVIENQVVEEVEKTNEVNTTTEAVEAIENEVAEEAEKVDEKHAIPMLDYSSMDLEKLAEELGKLIKGHPVQQIKVNTDAIKNEFNKKFGTLLAEKKAVFLEEGGNSIDFQYSSPIKVTYNKLLGEYKVKRDAYYGALETQLKDNLEKRNQVINSLKELIEKADAKTMYNEFKVIETSWKGIGAVPKTKYNDTWKIYHHHVERFYDLLHLNKDFRELDFKHNLEEKLRLISRAEALNEVEDINDAFKELQDLHRIWKEEVGPVGKEHREEVWHKFSDATKKIHDKRHEYFRMMKNKYQEIIDAKLGIVAEVSAYDTSKNKSHGDWQRSIIEIEALRKKYFDAGKLPYSKSEAVWQQFKQATKKFNQAKNNFYKEEKGSQNENLKEKIALVELAESLKESDDWDEATNTMKKIQSDWKKIGHVPRKFSDDIWKRFKGACNHYFDRLHDRKNELNKEQAAIVEDKKEFLEQFKQVENATLESIQEAISNWRKIGNLPRNARHIEGKFNREVDLMLEKLNLGKEEIAMLKFRNIIESYLAQEDFRKLDSEQLFLRKKIDETVREMQQLENNLSFISNATADNPLVMNVRAGINKFKDELDIWQLKLNYLKKLDY